MTKSRRRASIRLVYWASGVITVLGAILLAEADEKSDHSAWLWGAGLVLFIIFGSLNGRVEEREGLGDERGRTADTTEGLHKAGIKKMVLVGFIATLLLGLTVGVLRLWKEPYAVAALALAALTTLFLFSMHLRSK